MKKVSSLLLALAMSTSIISGVNIQSVNAQVKSESNQFIRTQYTIDDLEKMNMAEYYQKLFPEIYSELSVFEIDNLKTMVYGDLKEDSEAKEKSGAISATMLDLYNTSPGILTYKVTTTSTAGVLDSISHAIKLVDYNGRVWLEQNDSNENKRSLVSNGVKGGPSGGYRLEVVSRVKKSGYITVPNICNGKWVYM